MWSSVFVWDKRRMSLAFRSVVLWWSCSCFRTTTVTGTVGKSWWWDAAVCVVAPSASRLHVNKISDPVSHGEEYGELIRWRLRDNSAQIQSNPHMCRTDVIGIVWEDGWHVFKALHAGLRVCWIGRWGLTGEKQSGVSQRYTSHFVCPQLQNFKRLQICT